MGVVYVSHLEAGTLTRQTAGAEGRQTALVGHFGQRVGLVHKLRQGVGTEVGVDHRRDGLGVDQVDGGEHLIVADIHTLADGAGHTGESDTELVVKLLTDSADTTVAQVVDIIDIGLRVDKLDEILDNLDDVLLGQHLDIHGGVEGELLVDTVTAYLAEVVTLFREEKVGDYLAGRRVIWRLGVAQLPVYILDSLLLGVCGIFLEGVEDDGVVRGVCLFLVEEDGVDAGFKNQVDTLFIKLLLAVDDDLVTLDGNHFAGILVHEVLHPGAEHTGGELAAKGLLQVGLVDLDLLGQVENVNDVLVGLKTNRTQKSGHREFLLTVDVGIHDIVDVSCKLNPGATEGDDTGGIELCTVGVGALSEEHTGRTVELRHNDAFRAIDHESALLGHVRNRAEINILDNRREILVVGVGTVEFQFRLQGHTVCQATLQALLDGVAGRVDVIIEEFEYKVVTGVRYGEVLGEHLVESLVVPFFGRGVELQEVLERLELNLEEIRVRKRILYRGKIYAGFCGVCLG